MEELVSVPPASEEEAAQGGVVTIINMEPPPAEPAIVVAEVADGAPAPADGATVEEQVAPAEDGAQAPLVLDLTALDIGDPELETAAPR